jgi:hypothetical protein
MLRGKRSLQDRRWTLLLSIERLLTKTAVFFCVLLVTVQVVMTGEQARNYLSLVDRMEGEPIRSERDKDEYEPERFDILAAVNQYTPFRTHKRIRIHLVKPRVATSIKVVINGQVMGDFREGKCDVTLYPGDFLEIDARGFPEAAVLHVETLDKGLLSPVNGLIVETNGNNFALGKVKFK